MKISPTYYNNLPTPEKTNTDIIKRVSSTGKTIRAGHDNSQTRLPYIFSVSPPSNYFSPAVPLGRITCTDMILQHVHRTGRDGEFPSKMS